MRSIGKCQPTGMRVRENMQKGLTLHAPVLAKNKHVSCVNCVRESVVKDYATKPVNRTFLSVKIVVPL